MTAAIAALTFTSCSQDDDAANADDVATGQPAVLAIDGGENYIDLTTAADADWQIVDCPKWIVPVASSGLASDTIRIYVESNHRLPLRTGDIIVRYANGKTRTTRAEQDNTQSQPNLQRSFAVGWGFDVRTYNDSRGLRDQLFSIQRIMKDNDDALRRDERSASNRIDFFYGDDASDLEKNMKGSLTIDGKFKVFSLDLQANFGMSAINNSKRIFSWIRDHCTEYVTYFNNVDFKTAQKTTNENPNGWFTTDFATLRKEIIDSDGSQESIEKLINNYGTHFVTVAEVGGCCDYYFSSVFDNSQSKIDVQAALTFSYQSKFKLTADATYANDLKQMSNETIERFSVKGGNSVDLTNKVFTGAAGEEAMSEWKHSIKNKLELLNFKLRPITILFPTDIATKIRAYTDRLYYADNPVTRAE